MEISLSQSPCRGIGELYSSSLDVIAWSSVNSSLDELEQWQGQHRLALQTAYIKTLTSRFPPFLSRSTLKPTVSPMHAVRRALLESQADRLDLALHVVEVPSPCPNDVYEARMTEALDAAAHDGVNAVVFGDLFLEDVRRLQGTGTAGHRHCSPVSPLGPSHSRARTHDNR